MARSKARNFFITVFMILSFVVFVIVTVAILTINFNSINGWDDDYDDYKGFIIALLILIYAIPIIHSGCIIQIKNIRLKIAKEMNQQQSQVQIAFEINNENQNPGLHYLPPLSISNPDQAQRKPDEESEPFNDPRRISQSESSQIQRPQVAQLDRPEHLEGSISNHPYINQEDDENESLLGSFAISRRSSEDNDYRPAIN
jgi:hypothetical protein